MKRRVLAAAVFALLAGALSAPAAFAGPALRISGWARPFNLPVMMELESGAYKKAFGEFDVSVVDLQSGPNLMSALEAGEVDIVQGIGDAAFLVAASEGVGAKIIAVNSRSPKAFAVVAGNFEVRRVSDLKGRSVAGVRGSVVHQVFAIALAENGMSESDVEFFPMNLANATAALLAGKVDAALLVGADILRAERAGGVVLVDGEGRVRGLSLTVMRTQALREHPDIPARFADMRRSTLEAIASDRERAMGVAARHTKQAPQDLAPVMSWYDFSCEVTSDDVKSLEATKKYLLNGNIIRRDVEIEGLFN